jgi:MFS superfamily sulfate permease-like transporter
MSALLPIVLSMGVLILAQSAATSRAYAMKYNDRFDENVDLVGLGIGNLAAGISGTFVVNGSPTKTEMVDSAGGRSQLAQVTTSVIVIVTLLFFTVPLSYMPNAVLAAVVFLIGIKLVDYLGMTSIYRVRPGEFVVALITAATVVIVGVEQGIIVAIILSLILVLMHVYKPHDRVIAIAPDGTRTLGPVDEPVQAAPGLVIYAFGAELFYANATRFTGEVMSLVEGADPPLTWFVLDAAAMGDLDYSGADTLRQVRNELDSRGTRMVLCSVDPTVRKLLDAFGLTELFGATNIFATLQEAIDAYPMAAAAAPTAAPGPQSA